MNTSFLDHITQVEPPLGFTLFQLAAATGFSPEDLLAMEAQGRIRSVRLPNGQRFYAYAEVAWLFGEVLQ